MDKWLNNSNAIRVISVLLALIIWAIVHLDTSSSPQTVTSNRDTKVIEAVPITPVGLDEERFILTAIEPSVVRLVIEGRISNLLTAQNSDYVVELDLSNVKSGIQTVQLKERLPNGVSLVELSPREVTVKIEEIETRTVEVDILTVGEPEAGYIVGESRFTSEIGNVVEITMPQDDFTRLDKVAVTVDVTGATSLIENKKAKIVALDSQGNIIDNVAFNPETLSVQTDITLPSKDVPVQLRYSGQLPNDYSVSTISSLVETVKIFGFQKVLDKIEIYDGAIVDLSKITQSGEVKVKLNQVEGISKVEPAEIPVNVEIETSQQRTLENVPITVIGLEEGHKISVAEAPNMRLDVPIKGAPVIVSKVRNSDIVLTLDVTGLAVGEHTVSLIAELPAYVVTNVGFDYDVTIEILSEETLQKESDSEHVETIDPEHEESEQLPSD